jgi:hypothetical protein
VLSGGNEENQEKSQVRIGTLLRIKLHSIYGEGKGNVASVLAFHAIKTYGGAGGKTPAILNSAFILM